MADADKLPTPEEVADTVITAVGGFSEGRGEAADIIAARDKAVRAKVIQQMLKVVDAKDALLACYRLGTNPSDAQWKSIDKAREVVAALRAELRRG